MSSLTRKMIAKEFHQHRWMIAIAVASAIASIALCAGTGVLYSIGTLTWISAFVAFGVVLAMFAIASERKERVLQFVLSLPLSHADYVRIKLLALLLCYVVPWLVFTGGAVALVLVVDHLPDGMLSFVVLLCGFMLANFSLVLGSALLVRSEGAMVFVIIITNMGVSLFMFIVGALPGIQAHVKGSVPVWNATFWTVLAIEAAVAFACCYIPRLIAAQRRDFL